MCLGGDDRRILLWDLHKAIHGSATPVYMEGEHSSNVFTVALDKAKTKIFSGGNDDQVISHDILT